jgi:endo-1,4-beta-xylanase
VFFGNDERRGGLAMKKRLVGLVVWCLLLLAACASPTQQDRELASSASCMTIANGTYVIKSRSSGKALEVQNSGLSDNARVQQWEYVGIPTQQWRLERQSDGYYKILNNNSGKSLHVENASPNKSVRITQLGYTGVNHQRWCFVDVGYGYVAIAAKHSNRDIAVLGNDNGAPAQQYDTISPNGNFNWKLEKVAGTVTPPTTTGTLRAAADAKGFNIGVAVNGWALENNPTYKTIVATEFNMLTPENDMKWFMLRPNATTYNFAPADRLVTFAQSNRQQVRGHTLVWDVTLPAWLLNGNYSSAQVRTLFRDHIFTVMRHYQGKVKYWDVVNEALLDGKNQAGVDTSNFWYRKVGADYIEQSFRWAREADPSAKLFYNDFFTEGLNPKANAQYTLLKNLKAKGVPIDGVGLQMHLDHNDPPRKADLIANINRLSDLGLEVQITEIDVLVGGSKPSAAVAAKQTEIYRTALEACREARNCNTYVTWGVSDSLFYFRYPNGDYDAAFIWDVNYKRKPAYEAIRQALLK